jgi:hypothetical protein
MILGLCLATAPMAQVSSTKTTSAPANGIISVNNAWITKGDVDKVIDMYRQQMMRSAPDQEIGEPPPEVRLNVAKQLIINELLVQEAKKLHFKADAVKVDSIFSGIRQQFPDTITMYKAFASMGQSEQSIRSQIINGIIVNSLMQNTIGKVGNATAQDTLQRNALALNFIDSLTNAAKITYVDTTYKISKTTLHEFGQNPDSSVAPVAIDSSSAAKPASDSTSASTGNAKAVKKTTKKATSTKKKP